MAMKGAQEVRAHVTGAEMWCTATDEAWEARVNAMGAEMWGMATDGARDGAEPQEAQRGGTVRATLRRGHSYAKILRDWNEPNRCDTLTQW